MYVLRRRPEAFVEVVEMAESRLVSRPSSLATLETRLLAGELGVLPRTASEPLGSSDSLCGRCCGEVEIVRAALGCRVCTGGVLPLFRISLKGCLTAGCCRACRYRSAISRASSRSPQLGITRGRMTAVYDDVEQTLMYLLMSRIAALPALRVSKSRGWH